MSFGITRELIAVVISDYIRESSISTLFANGRIGGNTFFPKRWPTLTERKPQHLSTCRAQAANADTVNGFLDWLESSLTEVGLNAVDPELPNCLWKCDETAKINLA